MDARIAVAGVDGEIRHRLFTIVRSRSVHAQIGCVLFVGCCHFSLFIVGVATCIATFISTKWLR